MPCGPSETVSAGTAPGTSTVSHIPAPEVSDACSARLSSRTMDRPFRCDRREAGGTRSMVGGAAVRNDPRQAGGDAEESRR
ncbi:hypothetical protein Athai_67970 [Actinocatenispora thailandica]|uniref:Uncharacterized protein n=1 Tax=Actinocatenispora thailandica TaxID=227318 RepID=A0A7R7DWZ7_9ACTN|nr:hypothetical protein Athai_67970 [Actinocatenispora thailandica]